MSACDVNQLNKPEVSHGDGTVSQKSIEQTLVVIRHFPLYIHAIAICSTAPVDGATIDDDRKRKRSLYL